jgi:hypothetical protein
MIIRALDSNGDITFGQGTQNYLNGQAAIGLNIQTRLKSFLNNCFWAMGAGIDWFTLLGGGNTSTQIQLAVIAVIAQSYGVVSVNNVSASVNLQNRSTSVAYNAVTIYTSNFSAQLNNIEQLLLNI